MSGAPRTKLFVGHLPDGCTNDELFALFSKHGSVTECDVINKYGFVHMSTSEEAEEALNALNNFYFRGSSLSVERSKSKLHPEPGSQGRARGGTMMGGFRGRGGGFGGPPRGGFANGYRRFDGGPPFGNGRGDFGGYADRGYSSMGPRMRPYPSPYDRPSPSMGMPPREDYGYRSSPYASSPRDPYARPPSSMAPMSRDLYERRPTTYPAASDFLYSRRSPSQMAEPSRSSWYNDSFGDSSMSRIPPTASRPYF